MLRLLGFMAVLLVIGCSATTTDTQPVKLGTAKDLASLEQALQEVGVLQFEKHLAADWQVNLSGLVNLNHPKAEAAGLTERLEPIQLYVYSIKHPTHGTYLIDSGISESFHQPERNPDVSALVKSVMRTDLLEVRKTTATLAHELGGIDGVFLTHIHMDHIMGFDDLKPGTPTYIGPGDASARDVLHAATQGTTNRLLAHVDRLQEWQFDETGIIDVFGDGSFWAIHSPGHSPGTTAYIANTTHGPQLLLGDVTHTRWGWLNGVEPGTFSADIPTSVESLQRLITLAQQHPEIQVHPGHQSL